MSLDLCKGIAIVIDDKALPKEGEIKDPITKIISNLNKNGIPCCVYTKLTEAQKYIKNFGEVNFLILDWDLLGDLGHDTGIIIRESHSERVIKFIKDFRKICFCPIFIFSNANIKDIHDTLIRNELFYTERNNFIHVQAKKDLIKGDKLISIINNWVKNNPTIYTLKNWENSFSQAKTDTFWHLFSKSPVWPKVMWESFTEDSVDPHSNLNDIMYRLIKYRTSLTNLDPKIINRKKYPINHEEIKDVIQGMMFIDKNQIPENEIRPGDIFKAKGKYYMNIRPECDTIFGRIDSVGTPLFDGNVYLLEGSRVTSNQFKKFYFNPKNGINIKHDHVLIYGIDGKDFIRFNFKELLIKDYLSIKNTLDSRLISPYINNVQQMYSSYVGRFGLPRIPNRVLKGIK